jgi:hypothetical protein
MEVAVRDLEGKLKYETAIRKELEVKNDSYKEQLHKAHRELEVKSSECAEIPDLKKRIKRITESMAQLEHTSSSMKVTLRSQVVHVQTPRDCEHIILWSSVCDLMKTVNAPEYGAGIRCTIPLQVGIHVLVTVLMLPCKPLQAPDRMQNSYLLRNNDYKGVENTTSTHIE